MEYYLVDVKPAARYGSCMAGIMGMDRRTPRVLDGLKFCSACGQRKPLSEFHVRRASPDGRHVYCKACRRDKITAQRRDDPPGMRTCSLCVQVKPVSEFHVRKDGQQSWCKACMNYGREQRNYKLKAKYGIDERQYDAILREQGGLCAICRTDKPGTKGGEFFVVDHCHDSGRVRGLLCVPCNLLLGYAQDNPQVLIAACEYLGRC